MSRFVPLLLAILSLGFAPAPFLAPRPGRVADDLKLFQGEWEELRSTHTEAGRRVENGADKFLTAAYAGRSLTYRYKGAVLRQWEIVRIDSKANPKRMELRGVGPENLNVRMRCIFKFEGDRLVESYPGEVGGDYAPDFSFRPGYWLTVSRRKKP
jgi:uncharacterized protein (TIGR03067 family)